jgi:PAS domain
MPEQSRNVLLSGRRYEWPMLDSRSDIAAPGPADPLAALSDPRLHRFFAYLEARRGDREFAARRDLDPLEFGYVLGNVVLLEVEHGTQHGPLRFRYRLVGSVLAAGTGYDLTGSYVDAHPDPEYRAYVLARYRETVVSRRPTGGTYDLFMDRKPRQYQCLRVPLSEDGATVNMIIAAFILGSPVASAG